MSRPRLILFMLSLLILFLYPTTGIAESFYVPQDFATIGSALAWATYGDVIFVSGGTYYEHDLVVGNGVKIAGQFDRSVIIDAQGNGRVMLCEGSDSNTIIHGLTLIGGRADGSTSYDSSGGGLMCSNSTPWIINCSFIDNEATAHGGGIRCNHASPSFIECLFKDNQAALGGGGIDCSYESSPEFSDCIFVGNSASWGGALSCRSSAFPLLTDCILESNEALPPTGYGGGIFCDLDAAPELLKCTLRENSAMYGGAMACFEDGGSLLKNCTIVYNEALAGAGLYCLHTSPALDHTIIAFHDGEAISGTSNAHPTADCCDIFGNVDGDWTGPIFDQADRQGNFSNDPLFCPVDEQDANDNGGLNLQDDSPCREQNNACGLIGAWADDCDMAATFLVDFRAESTPGGIKIHWQVRSDEQPVFRLHAATTEQGRMHEWEVPYEIVPEQGFIAFDRSNYLTVGGIVTYHLTLHEDDDTWRYLGTTSLAVDLPVFGTTIKEIYPNPFNPQTTITFTIGASERAQILIYDMTGHKVVQLADETFSAGSHAVVWNGRDGAGRVVSSGTYIALLRTNDQTRTQKLTLLK